LSNAELITSIERLEEVTTLILKKSAVAVDTEFFWERTFYPILGLVQLATDDGSCWLVDTVKISDISALAPVLEAKSIVKVLHDAPQDLGILSRATGAQSCNIFDTRVAAGFAGFESTCSLQSLLRETMDIELSKAETRSNWIKRPLSESQLRYAAGDVIHMLELREILIRSCSSDTVRSWLEEENALFDRAEVWLEREPRLMYLRVKGFSRLRARQLAILREVAAWREMEARQRDWPRGHVLRDPVLIDIAQLAPYDYDQLRSICDFPQRMPDGIMDGVLHAIKCGTEVPEENCPVPKKRNSGSSPHFKSRTQSLLAHIRSQCANYRVDSALVASRADAESLIELSESRAEESHPLTQGWRGTIIEGF